MAQFRVVFCTSYEIEASDENSAEDAAWEQFRLDSVELAGANFAAMVEEVE